MKTRKLGRVVHSGGKVKLVMNEPGCLTDFMEQLEDNQRVWVTIEKYQRKRSLSQNSMLHWIFQEIADETGHDRDWVKDFFAKKYLTVDLHHAETEEILVDAETGEVLTRVRSTAELNTVEFGEYVDRIRLYANEFLGLQLPEPSRTKEINFK